MDVMKKFFKLEEIEEEFNLCEGQPPLFCLSINGTMMENCGIAHKDIQQGLCMLGMDFLRESMLFPVMHPDFKRFTLAPIRDTFEKGINCLFIIYN